MKIDALNVLITIIFSLNHIYSAIKKQPSAILNTLWKSTGPVACAVSNPANGRLTFWLVWYQSFKH